MDENVTQASQPTSSKSSTPKILILVAGVAILIALGVGAYRFLGEKETKPVSQTTTANAQLSPTPGSVISSIKEALVSAASLQCDYTDEDGRKIASYLKAGAIRADIAAPNPKESSSMIMKDKKLYLWSGKEGTVMSFDLEAITANVTPQASQTTSSTRDPQDMVQAMEKYKDYCKPATVSDVQFVPPVDVKFTDLSSVTKTGSQQTVPQSGSIPSGITEEQLKTLQEQYQQ